MRKLLIIGARKDSLGDAVAKVARGLGGTTFGTYWSEVRTAGVSGEEDSWLDVTGDLADWWAYEDHTDVVCTAGLNASCAPGDDTYRDVLAAQMAVNAVGPLNVLDAWFRYWRTRTRLSTPKDAKQRHALNFVVIGSNSASIARTDSVAYCASKAALGMGVRSFARSIARTYPHINVWGYEPPWINGTPMSTAVTQRLGPGAQPHRIPSGQGVDPLEYASLILADVMMRAHLMKGNMHRIDQGDQ